MPDEAAEARAHALLAAQIILDGVRAADPADDARINDGMQEAFGRLVEIGAIGIVLDESEGEAEIQLDVAPLLSGLTLVVGYLADQLGLAEGVSREEIIADVREAFIG
ncbi:hypothetical protein [Nocardioides conyzicola]|uniref:BetI-type transcriptional repressor C-terminal domain-containing protein n=1 Tax=Nocardioides conyzicola TaxID=1651781 RepID=A0ABP8XD67_9ACTN